MHMCSSIKQQRQCYAVLSSTPRLQLYFMMQDITKSYTTKMSMHT